MTEPTHPDADKAWPEETFRLIADFTYDWELWLGPNGECLYVSPSCERITGYRPEAFMNAPGMVETLVHPDDLDLFRAHVEQERLSDEGFAVEYRILTAAGEERWIGHACQAVSSAHGVRLGRRISNRDITDRVRTEQAYRTLVDHTFQALFIFQDGRVIFANHAAVVMSGYAVEELEGWHVEDMIQRIHAEDRPVVWQRFLDRVAGKVFPNQYSFRFVRKDGEVRWWEIYSVGVPHRGRPAVHVACTDVTERETANQERSAALEALHRSEEQYRKRSEELEALHDVSLRLASQLDLSTLLQLIVEQAVALLGVEAGALMLHDAARKCFRMEVGTSSLADMVGATFGEDEGMAGEVFRTQRSLVVSDYPAWSKRLTLSASFPHLLHLMAVPLVGEERVLGVLDFASADRQFDERDIWLAEMFAAQATAALESARLHAEVKRRARETSALNRASHAITSVVDREAVLQLVISEVRDLLNADGVWVLLCERLPDGTCKDLTVVAASPGLDRVIGARIPLVESIAGDVAQRQAAALVFDGPQDARFYKGINDILGLEVRALLVAPLIVRETVVGVLEASKQQPGGFDEQDLAVFEGMARAAAIALDNASLLQAEREQFQWLQESQAQMVRVEKMAALGRMAAALAHEINNPLQAMQSHLELVMDFPLPPEQHGQFLGVVRSEIERLKEIVQRVLDFARPTLAPRRTVALADLVRQTLLLAGKQLQRASIQVEVDVPEDLIVAVAPDQMVQVFLNLVINAIEAIGKQGHLWLSGEAGHGEVRLRFVNDGNAIPEEALPHIFEPFYTTKTDGTGLGLAVSQNLVEQFGGRLSVANLPGGKGVAFTVRLPFAQPSQEVL